MDDAELLVDHVDVSYGKTQVLWDISLGLGKNEIVAIAGGNGAGKSTLLKTIAGVIRPDRGTVSVAGSRIDGNPAHWVAAHGVRLIAEGGRIFPNMSVADNLAMGAYLVMSEVDRRSALESIFDFFPDLRAKLKEPARTLSGGQRQMLAVAIGLASRPRLLLVDEPSSGLSPLMVSYLMDMISKSRDVGVSILLVEQNIRAALGIADRGYVLENGRIVLEGSAWDLQNDDYVKMAYLGL